MSDLSKVDAKLQEGADWRGTIRVNLDDEEYELTVRQLRDPEFREVMSKIDRDELQELRERLPSDAMETMRELRQKDELTEEEEDRLEDAQGELNDAEVDIFEILSDETFAGIRQTAKYAVEPDEEDIREAFMERAHEIESEYGVKVSEPEDVMPALQDDIEAMVDKATNMASFTIGIQCLVETVGESEGN
jgi:hypothetical protein